jgi:hypothetical protein
MTDKKISERRELNVSDLAQGRRVVLRSAHGAYSLPMWVRQMDEHGVAFETTGNLYMVFFGRYQPDGTVTDSSGVRLFVCDME